MSACHAFGVEKSVEEMGKNKKRNGNFIENMAAVRRDRQKNGVLER
jgi:hypothetical protein